MRNQEGEAGRPTDQGTVVDQNCFLCYPDSRLVFLQNQHFVALAGLGPLMPGYSVIASKLHVRSTADMGPEIRQQFGRFAGFVRSELSTLYGSCVVAEHGRMPVCVSQVGLSEPHCYHAHFLLFPGTPVVDALALQHFAHVQGFETLDQALFAASEDQEEYYLLSSVPQFHLVMTGISTPTRQFSRGLVAAAIGMSNLANWQANPSWDEALKNAYFLREHFRVTGDSRT